MSLLSHLCIFEKFVKSGLAQSCLYLHDNLTGCFLSFFFTTFGKNPFAVMSKYLGWSRYGPITSKLYFRQIIGERLMQSLERHAFKYKINKNINNLGEYFFDEFIAQMKCNFLGWHPVSTMLYSWSLALKTILDNLTGECVCAWHMCTCIWSGCTHTCTSNLLIKSYNFASRLLF